MAILDNDIKIMRSAVMDDVDEGGGAATGNEVADGVSNNMFPDISEIDRTLGRLQLRKVFPAVRTNNTDTYLGANVMVLDPPDDPRVSAVLFSTDSDFDTRKDAQSRIESYLSQGTLYEGLLFGNQITGQRTISVLQRKELPIPVIGSVLLLRKNEGLSSQADQYVRVMSVDSIVRTFTTTTYDFERRELTIGISDPLRNDFPGFQQAIREDASVSFVGMTKIYKVIVADAARYYGIVPLKNPASISDLQFDADGVQVPIVPSAQVETPIADAQMNQQSRALVPTGGTLNVTLSHNWNATTAMYVGGNIMPGSLIVTRSGITVTDQGGALYSAGVQVGSVDYTNGVLTLSTNLFGTTTGSHTVSFVPAGRPNAVTQSVGFQVTISNRSLSYVVTLMPTPARKSLEIDYMAGGNWYTLSEDGSGAIKGLTTGTGAGSINYTTGTVTVTLGALPDVGSSVIYRWVEEKAAPLTSTAQLTNDGKVFLAMNTDGVLSLDAGVKAITPGTVSFAWNDGTAHTATDNGLGGITGDASGTIDYGRGVISLSPNALPAPGTNLNVTITGARSTTNVAVATLEDEGANWGFDTSPNVTPGTVNLQVNVTKLVKRTLSGVADVDETHVIAAATIYDDGAGNLRANHTNAGSIAVGTIDYTTGRVALTKGAPGYYCSVALADYQYWTNGHVTVRANDREQIAIDFVPQSLEGQNDVTGTVAGGSAVSDTFSVGFDQLTVAVSLHKDHVLSTCGFTLGSSRYVFDFDSGNVYKDPSAATGLGTVVGTVNPSLGQITITSWPSASSLVANWFGLQGAPVDGVTTGYFTNAVLFRTASAPIRVGSLSIQGTMTDGTPFNVTADSAGKIDGTRVKGRVDYTNGVVELYFVGSAGSGSAPPLLDLSFLGIAGVTTAYASTVRSSTLKYNAVAYSYVPLDADIIGVDPVRLPTDGRVPIFQSGSVVVVHNTQSISQTVANGDVVDCGRTRLARVRVKGATGATITTGYTADLDAGTVTFTNVSGYAQPIVVEHRIEDTVLASEVQINGTIRATRPLTHEFPVPGSYVSSALVVGDRHARVSAFYDQATWTNVWSDDLIGTSATSTFNNAAFPPVVTNVGAVTERWALVFTNTTTFNIIGEHVGQIASGVVTDNAAPINPATGLPYFTIPWQGFGSGWSAGNVIRFNTVGAMFPVWVARVIAQGPATEQSDSFEILVRGDVDA